MEVKDNQIRLYSISEAAREMHIGKESLYSLINQGKIGTVSIGRTRKIWRSEIIRFLTENTFRTDHTLTSVDVENYFSSKSLSKSKKTDTYMFIKQLREAI